MSRLNYGGQLKLMDVPAATKCIEPAVYARCGFCGLTNTNKGKLPVVVNGVRINGNHRACIKLAARPMFDMSESLFRDKNAKKEKVGQ